MNKSTNQKTQAQSKTKDKVTNHSFYTRCTECGLTNGCSLSCNAEQDKVVLNNE